MLNITQSEDDGMIIVTLEGDIDGKTAPEAQSSIIPLIEEHKSLLLDMTQVNYMSSAGLRTMLLLYRQATAKDGHLVLVGLSEEVKDTMSATGFLDFFTIADNLEAGLAAL